MNQLRLDPLSGRWVAVSTERLARGAAFIPRQRPRLADRRHCPYCADYEGPKEIAVIERNGGAPAWEVMVVPNRFPAFEGNEPFVVDHRGPVFTEAPASGIHEVLLFSDDHDLSWAGLTDEHVAVVMSVIRDRIETHQQTPGLRYSQAIVNAGREAGASIDHPHGQLLGIPFVPRDLVDEQGSFARFAGGCLLCTAAASEERVGYRLVDRSRTAVTFAPYWSGTPYELLIVPRHHEAHLHRSPDEDLAGVGNAVRNALAALRRVLGDVAYNVVFHAAPYRASAPYHWHVHVLPKLTTRAGIELGTGVYINVVAPERAAEDLRNAVTAIEKENHSSEGVAS